MKKILSSKNLITFIAFVLLIGVFTGCVNQGIQNTKDRPASLKEASYHKITPEEAKKRLDSENGIILLDVRTKEEYETGHIKNAILIPVDDLEAQAVESLKDKTAPIFVYCRSGNRSAVASSTLANMGYTNVYDLGGIKSWPYETVQ